MKCGSFDISTRVLPLFETLLYFFQVTPENAPIRETLSLEVENENGEDYDYKKVKNEMALLPDVTYEDRFIHIGTQNSH